MKKAAIVVAVVVALVAGGGWWWVKKRGAKDAGKYRTEVVDRGAVAMTVTATGTISALTTVQVGSQVSGIIAALHADFNTPVTKGQLVAELDPAPFEATVAQRRADVTQAEVRLRNSKIQFERQQRLLDDKLVAQADYDQAKADFETAAAALGQAQAALEQSETNLAYTKIRSPIDGVVVDRQYDVGQTVAASFQAPTLFTVAQDLTKMQLQADVDQSDIGRVQVGQKARFTVDAYPDDRFTATITQVRLNATVNQNVVTYPVILEVDNPDLKLRPKMTADLTVEVDRVNDALRIPNAALRFRPPEEAAARAGRTAGGAGAAGGSAEAGAARRGGGEAGGGFARAAEGLPGAGERGERGAGQAVYRLGADGKLARVRVRTGLSDGRYTQVVDGDLKEGDTIVVGLATATAGEASTARSPLAGGGRRF